VEAVSNRRALKVKRSVTQGKNPDGTTYKTERTTHSTGRGYETTRVYKKEGFGPKKMISKTEKKWDRP
jgi:hypothetical protein